MNPPNPSEEGNIGNHFLNTVYSIFKSYRETRNQNAERVSRRFNNLKMGPFGKLVYNVLCVPSQKGLLPLCLQPQKNTFFASVISTLIGVKGVPLCIPEQNG